MPRRERLIEREGVTSKFAGEAAVPPVLHSVAVYQNHRTTTANALYIPDKIRTECSANKEYATQS